MIIEDIHTCLRCGAELNNDNWYPSYKQKHYYECKTCTSASSTVHDRRKKTSRRNGHLPFNENKNCPQFLGVHVAERVLSRVFTDIKIMPMHNHGFDFICNKDKKIDVKSSCMHTYNGSSIRYVFHINKNVVSDYFLCLAFDDREHLNPEHIWLIPAGDINDKASATISENKIDKWIEYELDIDKVITCCDTLKGVL